MRIKEFDVKKEAKKLDRKYSNKQRLILSIIGLILLTFLIYTSYAIFIVSDKDNITNTNVGTFSTGDVKLALYIDGTKQPQGTAFPAKGSGKEYEKLECNNSGTGNWDRKNWKLSINAISNQTACTIYFITGTSLHDKILTDNGGASTIAAKGKPDFANAATTDEGMFASDDEYGISYYYRGAVTNNNVMFGGYAWKIIRINGDGSIRMIYNGTSATNTTGPNTRIDISQFNASGGDNRYVGYMYGSTCTDYITCHTNTIDSTIKGVIDNWYNTNVNEKDKLKVADNIFCNDRNILTGTGVGTVATNYIARDRLVTNKLPSLKCSQINDQFTISTSSRGNGALTYPVGLITADEIAMAGGLWDISNSNYYLNTGEWLWTMTPYAKNSAPPPALSFCIASGRLSQHSVDSGLDPVFAVRPVISLNSSVIISSGNGSTASPYIVE